MVVKIWKFHSKYFVKRFYRWFQVIYFWYRIHVYAGELPWKYNNLVAKEQTSRRELVFGNSDDIDRYSIVLKGIGDLVLFVVQVRLFNIPAGFIKIEYHIPVFPSNILYWYSQFCYTVLKDPTAISERYWKRCIAAYHSIHLFHTFQSESVLFEFSILTRPFINVVDSDYTTKTGLN